MKKINYYIIFVTLTYSIISCSNTAKNTIIDITSSGNYENQNDDTLKGALKKIELELPEFIISYHNEEFKKQLEKGEYYLFTSKKYIAFKINEQSNFEAELGWKVFLIKGEVQLSKDDFAEYDFYGIYKKDKVYAYGFLAQPVEIVTELKSFEVTNNSAIILGKQWDMSDSDDAAKQNIDQNILLIYP